MTDVVPTSNADGSKADEAESPLAKAKAEAELRKAIAEADQQAAEARQKQVSALLPDLTKVTPGSLEAKGEQALFGTALAQQAMGAAGVRIADLVGDSIADPASARILITSDAELATSDAIYVEVVTGLDQLNDAAAKLIKDIEPKTEASFGAVFAGPAIAGAVAAALPGVLSLISAHRSLTTSAVTVDSLTAAAVVAGRLSRREHPPAAVVHDDIRLVPEKGAVQKSLAKLNKHREELLARKIALEDENAAREPELAELKAKAKKDPGKAMDVAKAEGKASEITVRLGLIDSTTATIDKFTASLQAKAEGATRSPLAAAILHEQLHRADPDGGKFTHVLFVKAEPGSAQQLIDDRPLAFKDKFSTIATSSVTYMLIDTAGSTVIDAGSVGGEAKITGSIGSDVTVRTKVVSSEAYGAS
jgi:hypothetical protein